LSPGSGSPQDGERIPLLDEGFPQLLSVCPARRAASRLYTAWIEGDLPVWRDGKLADPDEYSFGVRTVDGRERLKVRKGTDAVTTSGDRLLGIDQSNHKWETSAAGIVALRERLIKEQLPAAPIEVRLVGRPRVLVERPTLRAKAQSPSQLTDDQIQALMGDVSGLSDLPKKIRRYTVLKYGAQWKDHNPAEVLKNATGDPLYEKEVGSGIVSHITTFRRALRDKDKK
jgi:hypothetical protein